MSENLVISSLDDSLIGEKVIFLQEALSGEIWSIEQVPFMADVAVKIHRHDGWSGAGEEGEWMIWWNQFMNLLRMREPYAYVVAGAFTAGKIVVGERVITNGIFADTLNTTITGVITEISEADGTFKVNSPSTESRIINLNNTKAFIIFSRSLCKCMNPAVLTLTEDDGTETGYCQSCLDTLPICSVCNLPISSNSNSYRTRENTMICNGCIASSRGYNCSRCGYVYFEEPIQTADGTVCPACYAELYGTCGECNTIVRRDRLSTYAPRRRNRSGSQTAPSSTGVVCQECIRRLLLPSCAVCAGVVRRNTGITFTHSSNRVSVLCRECADGSTICCMCGNAISISDSYIHTDRSGIERNYCGNCNRDYATHVEARVATSEEMEVTLSLLGEDAKIVKLEKRKLVCTFNEDDAHLEEIVEMIGLVDNPVYVYGLKDRPEFDISVSGEVVDLLTSMGKITSHNGKGDCPLAGYVFNPECNAPLVNDKPILIIINDIGHGNLSIGISRSLRENAVEWVAETIKTICSDGKEV